MWIWIIIAAVIGLYIFLKMKSKGNKYGAANNALMAKYTFSKLDHDLKDRVKEITLYELGRGGVSNPIDTINSMTETQLYGFYAMGMAQLGIEPLLTNEKWSYVENPFVALINAEIYIDNAKQYLKQKHNIDVALDN